MKKVLFLISLILFVGCNKEEQYSGVNLSKIKIIAHKGGSNFIYPENSLEAIRYSLDVDIDGIEIDVRLTKDKQLVLLHDETIDRTTIGAGKIQNLTLEEAQQFDLINNNVVLTGQKIPTLTDVVNLVNGKKELYIEIKDHSDILISKLLSFIAEKNLYEWIRIISFGQSTLLKIKKQYPEIKVGNVIYTETGKIGFRSEELSLLRYLFVDYRSLDRHNVEELNKSGKMVFVYTLNDIKDMSVENYQWINGIVTDNTYYWLELKRKKSWE